MLCFDGIEEIAILKVVPAVNMLKQPFFHQIIAKFDRLVTSVNVSKVLNKPVGKLLTAKATVMET